MYHHAEAHLPPHGAEGRRRHHGAAVPRGDGAGPARSAQAARGKVRLAAIEMVHGSAGSTAFGIKKNLWAPAAVGRDFDLSPSSLSAARAVPRRHHHRQQHRRAQRRGVHGAGDRRRSLPLERGVPDADAPEADAGLGRVRRHLARSDLRAAIRPGHARFRRCSCASRTSTRRAAARTATRAPTPTRSAGRRPTSRCRWCATRAWCSTAVRRRRHAGRARASGAARTRASSTGSAPSVARLKQEPRRRRPRAAGRLPRRRARDRAPHPAGRGAPTAAASRASCRARRSACPTRSPSTSS